MKRLFSLLRHKHPKKTLFLLLFLGFGFWWSLPNPLFDTPTSTVLLDKDEKLLGARIASDGQWRFPNNASVPDKFKKAIISFEDRRFYYHPGIDPVGICRAIQQNIQNNRLVSGGSTISMQVIRMARGNQRRSIFQKIIEAILAIRLEIGYTKGEILSIYAANAPFGGNVVGLDAASWRYYNKPANLLSWAEAATLAVLPNSPSLIHISRNRTALKEKRNRLLHRMSNDGIIDSTTLSLALLESLPEKPHPLPNLAPHLLELIKKDNQANKVYNQITKTTIDKKLQRQVNNILGYHQQNLSGNGIHNVAALIIDNESNEVLAYTGNTIEAGKEHGSAVNIIEAPRSTGSILKPFLYALAINDGIITPNSLLSDTPTYLNGYRPKNYTETYSGMTTAKKALIRSLNIPFVRLLQEYGLEKFHFDLQQLNQTKINQSASHYGLTLILGGAETSLWDATNTYAGIARTVNHFQPLNGKYQPDDFQAATWIKQQKKKTPQRLLDEAPILSAAACWHTLEAMSEVERPDELGEWKRFNSSKKIAWKTGTSFGFRDAWAIGTTKKYTVGVWVGNADGEGRPGLVGVRAAAPILFGLFNQLDHSEWFLPPYDEMQPSLVCSNSGFSPSIYCPKDSIWLGNSYNRLPNCSYHQRIHLDSISQLRVHRNCSNNNISSKSWFVLPPIEAYYYKKNHPNYSDIPPYRPDCKMVSKEDRRIKLIYPKYNSKIYVPIDLDGTSSKTILKAAHRTPNKKVFWHLDGIFLGTTIEFHEMALKPDYGQHTLTLVDEDGYKTVSIFEILSE